MTTEHETLRRRAQLWRALDPDEAHRATVKRWLDDDDRPALADAFGSVLSFGTAGIRGRAGAGAGSMNRLMVRFATDGLARVLLERVSDAVQRGVAVGFDARPHSDSLADDAVRVLRAHGFRVIALDGVAPTPFVPFLAKRDRLAAGIVLTASHNPPGYNGFKVYGSDGAPLVPPLDQAIAEAMNPFAPGREPPRIETDEAAPGIVESRSIAAVQSAYDADVVKPLVERLSPPMPADEPIAHDVVIAYTPVHGVAGHATCAALRLAGFDEIRVVADQFEPDGEFPTVMVPNPELPDALARVLALAREANADLVLANDPDGDRLAVAVPDGDDFRVLHGDEIGCLLADRLLSRSDGDESTRGRPFVLNTLVSSRLLGRVAARHGADWEQTPTGLKWIWRRALQRMEAGDRFVMGYEEAIGYAVSDGVRDKDGISAAVAIALLAADCRARGESVADRLDALYRETGAVSLRQVIVHFDSPADAKRCARQVDEWRARPPEAIGTLAVATVSDYRSQQRHDLRAGHVEKIDLPPNELLQITFERGVRLSLRASGTEPKFKIYLECLGEPDPSADPAARLRAGDALLDRLEAAVRRHFDGQDA